MATLSSSSTDAEVWAAYDDAASYEEDSDRAKALAFTTACRILLRRRPRRMNRDGTEVEFDAEAITKELAAAQKWVARHPSSSGAASVRYGSLEDFRA